MNWNIQKIFATVLVGIAATGQAATDPRLRVELYNPEKVVTVMVKRGVTTHIQLGASEHIMFVSTGIGADCAKETDTWCVVAPSNGNQLFIKPKSKAAGSNNVAIATNEHAYSLRFNILGDEDEREPVYRLTYGYPEEKPPAPPAPVVPEVVAPPSIPMPTAAETVKERLKAAPPVINSNYSMKFGKRSGDIAPTLVFDDGRFTYFRYPNNREVPAVFAVDDDGQESVVNVHMETDSTTGRKDLLCVDLVAKRFYLRRGKAVIGIWNDAFDLDGRPPLNGTTVAGVERVVKGAQ